MITHNHKGGGGESRRFPKLIMRYLNSPLFSFCLLGDKFMGESDTMDTRDVYIWDYFDLF